MKLNRFWSLAGLIVWTFPAVCGADAVGKITLKGTPPAPTEATLEKTCGQLRKEDKIKIFDYAVGLSNALADVVVYVKGAPNTAPRTDPVVLEHKNCQYTTLVAAAQVNQPVMVRNSDPLMHSVRFKPTAAGNKGASLIQYTKAADLKFTFPTPEEAIEFKSDYHPWVVSHLYVLDTPYYAITDTNGVYSIPNLPAGSYTLVARHRKGGTIERPLEIQQKNATNNISFEVK